MTNGVLVDSNVLVDVISRDPDWFERSSQAIETLLDSRILIINPIIYAEVGAGFSMVEQLESALPPDLYARHQLPWDAAFAAGRAFVRYRQSGGTRTAVLPDFYIGAHAQVADLALLTRDAARYRTYFPSVHLISP
jgi:hypothetical protein